MGSFGAALCRRRSAHRRIGSGIFLENALVGGRPDRILRLACQSPRSLLELPIVAEARCCLGLVRVWLASPLGHGLSRTQLPTGFIFHLLSDCDAYLVASISSP
jgi:hypothetical protein